ncbi:nucleoside-diphosphate kinase [Candidatus Contubernalis alkaliaceticus]|uniref:nucleoside-diphosphate kinase n=1 Tax=Candidatus Contubernalis alkaliaceticus TaxID=338645 RepID=UPI001F4BDBBB|nr:nucleoside-diphosphate kinase [Candidatus Contubernalis alkalaceticus]UNC92444.1 nucleoside-diphosphate kinase [Candidatus Contubernalis alkalaceticus]
MEKTFVMIKPDGVQRNLVGEVIKRFEKKGLKLVAMKMLIISRSLAEEHYKEHVEKPFFEELVSFIISGPAVAMIWEGREAINLARNMLGKTNPSEAAPGTIRGDFGIYTGNNVIHGSDALQSAEREINLFFKTEEILSYTKDLNCWVYGQ